jgi:hypothetical protein
MFHVRRSDPIAPQRPGRGPKRSKRRGRAERLLPLALALMLMVVAVPAAAKGPALYPLSKCAPVVREDIKASPRIQALCERSQARGDRKGLDGTDAGLVAGSMAVVMLLTAGGLLVAVHRRDTDRARPAALS